MASESIRVTAYYALFAPRRWPERLIVWCVAAAIVLSVALGILTSEPSIDSTIRKPLELAQNRLGWVFAVEYLIRTWCVGEETRHRGLRGRLRYVVSPLALIDLVAILPVLLPTSQGDEWLTLRALRVLRIVSVLKLGRYSVAMQTFARVVTRCSGELGAFFVVVLVTLVLTATLMYGIEPGTFKSMLRALWWSVITLTTIGYGDTVPKTGLGQLIGGFVALLGIGVVAIPAGILANGFRLAYSDRTRGKARSESAKRDVCPHCGRSLDDGPATGPL